VNDVFAGASYWAEQPAAVAAAWGTGTAGLTRDQAAVQRATFGSNSVDGSPTASGLQLFLRQFMSPLVLILVFATAISLMLHQWIDAGIILAIVLSSSLLSFVQEHRASKAVEELKKRLALTARVLRDGSEQVLPVTQIVPGDVIALSAGNLVPADGLIVEAQDFLVSEASMTGESYPVEKRAGLVAADAPLAERTNTVFLGSSVRSGTAKVLVVLTGRQTEFGEIAARLRSKPPETDFARGVRHFGDLLMRVMIVIVLFVLTINLLLDRPVTESLLFAVALAVGLSPELLPAIISVTLSAGARAMGKRGVIVRRLDAIENLGSMNILCTDKTGTLTEGTIVLTEVLDAAGRPSDEVRWLAFINASLETGIENPLDAAIVAASTSAGMTATGLAKVDEIPYDFVRRRLTIVVSGDASPGRHLFVTKGAFSNVLDCCTALERDGAEVPLDDGGRRELEALFKAKGDQGFRVLALATRSVVAQPDYGREDERNMVFRGFLVFLDPPKPEARDIIQNLARLGIAIKIISGDNRHVTAHMAEVVGLNATSMLTGEELSVMKDEALWHLAPRTDLFVEIDPQQKERIVLALQRTGNSVGYLGDGINDAPALHAADVGISVSEAVDVARESADIILLSRDLDVLRQGVEDGRRTFANTLKYISITTSANFGNMISMALATPFLPFLPLAAKQILLNNFLSDLPSIAISSDNVDPERLSSPQRWNIKDVQRFMIVFGLISSVFDLLTFGVLLYIFNAGQAVFQTSWFMISLLTELAVVLVLRTRKLTFKSRPGRLLLWSSNAVAVATFAIPFLREASSAFGFVSLSPTEVVAVVLIVAGYILATEIAKAWYFRAEKGDSSTLRNPA
jgi:P-type Mg2+ transporter